MSQDARRDEENSTSRRAQVLGLNYIDTSQIGKQLFKGIMTVEEMYRFRVIPLIADGHNIHFGITTITSQQTLNALKTRFTDHKIEYSIISETGYNEYMKLYDPPKQIVYEDINVNDTHSSGSITAVSETLDKVSAADMLAYIVKQADTLAASDIHIECQSDHVRVRFRIDGVLHPIARLSPEKYRQLSSVIAAAADISTGVKEPQTGHINRDYKLATGEMVTVNLRIETVPSVYGMDAVMRLFTLKIEFFKLENLGLSEHEMMSVQDVIAHPTGMVLVVGPTGSGKTTTLYSLINTLNTDENKIITLEDPVEYFMPGVVQIPVEGQLQGQGFAEMLRAVLRLDPDVVMIGEIRDQDTAKTALQAALTGHLVMSTFHASSAAAALTRMLDSIGINPLFSSAMHLIMAQRLVRKLDESSKEAYQPDDSLKSLLQTVIDSFPPGVSRPDVNNITLYKAVKTENNPFGYSGQLALREQLQMTPGVRELLRLPPNQITTESLQNKAVEEGMLTMLHDGLLKAIAGVTTIEEVYRVVG